MAHRVIKNPKPGQPEQSGKDELEVLREFFRNHGQRWAIALGVGLVLVLSWSAYQNHRKSSAIRASQMLMNARSSTEIQQVVSQYPSTPTAPLALLTLAARYYDEGQHEMARHTYTQFTQKHPTHSLAEIAILGNAQCLESEGKFQEAIRTYESLLQSKPDHFLSPLAQLGKARTLMQMGRYDDARVEYEDFIAANPDSDWATLAESALMFVDKEMRAAARGIIASPVIETTPFAFPPMGTPPEGREIMEMIPVQEPPDQTLPEEE